MKKNYGLIAAAAIILFSAYVYINTLTITSTAGAALGPAFMPKLVAVILFVLGWLDLIGELKKKKAAGAKAESGTVEKSAATAAEDSGALQDGTGSCGAVMNKRTGSLTGLLAARVDVFSSILLLGYVFSLKRLGFLIASAVYMLLQMLLLTVNTKRNYILIIFMTIVVPTIIYFGFVKIFYLMLPPGILG